MRNLNICIVQNNKKDYSRDYEKIRDYFFRKAKISITYTKIESNIPVTLDFQQIGSNGVRFGSAKGVKQQIEKLVPKNQDIILFVFHNNETNSVSTGWYPTSNTMRETVQDAILCQIFDNDGFEQTDWFYKSAVHEIMHAFAMMIHNLGFSFRDEMDLTNVNGTLIPYWNNSDPESTEGNFSRCFKNLEPYWDKIFPQKTMNKKYKYFKESEVVGLKPEFVTMLDKARGIAGVPFVITSGYRTPEKNSKVGGVENSTHTTGLGADIKCTDSGVRFKMIKAFLEVGFARIGIYKAHIHVDMGKKPQYPENVIWFIDKE